MDSESSSIGGCSITSPLTHQDPEKEVNSPTAVEYVPKVGDRFETIDEAFKFYTLYGIQRGFSVRRGSEKKDRDGNVAYKTFTCNKQGYTRVKKVPVDDTSSTTTRNTAVRRFGCLAKVSLVLRNGGFYEINVFNDEHSHPLTSPRSSYFLKSNRNVTDEMMYFMDAFDRAGIPQNLQIRLMVGLSVNGVENLGCLVRDIQNARAHDKLRLQGHDANTLLVYFETRKRNNPNFEYSVLRDDKNTFKNCYWSDAHAKMSYTFFGDCCVMDSTYKTNKYHMIFATIAGVNHHRQTVVFGSALLSGESVENYIWFLKTWLNSMTGSVQPKIIITDQDAALRIAISQVLPKSFHRLCIWHIVMKFDKKLNKEQFGLYYGRFKEIIYNSKKGEDFEKAWTNLVEEAGGLRHTPWFREIFDVRSSWVPAYCKNIFSAGMSSSQRVESSHAFFKQYVSENNSLTDFMIRYDNALEKQRGDEVKADHADQDEGRRCFTLTKLEKEMGDMYTKENFKIFQEELLRSQQYLRWTKSEQDPDQHVYKVFKEETNQWEELMYKPSTNFAICACHKFENEGIPCCHILFLYRKMEQAGLPKEYLLHRWTKEIKATRQLAEEKELSDGQDADMISRKINLSRLAQKFVNQACMTIEASDFAKSMLLAGITEVEDGNKESGFTYSRDDPSSSVPMEGVINDPKKVKTKGSGVPKRYKSGREIVAVSKLKRICGRCGVRGHNSRKCKETP